MLAVIYLGQLGCADTQFSIVIDVRRQCQSFAVASDDYGYIPARIFGQDGGDVVESGHGVRGYARDDVADPYSGFLGAFAGCDLGDNGRDARCQYCFFAYAGSGLEGPGRIGDDRVAAVTDDAYACAVLYQVHNPRVVGQCVDGFAVNALEYIAVAVSGLVHYRVKLVSGRNICRLEYHIAPVPCNTYIYSYGEQEVEKHAGHHYHKPRNGFLGAEFPRLRLGGQLVLIGGLVYHSGYGAVAAQRQPAKAVEGVAPCRLGSRLGRMRTTHA